MQKSLAGFEEELRRQEKSEFTIDKYLRDIRLFVGFLGERELTKELTVSFKTSLIESGRYADSSINSMIASLRAYLKYLGRPDCFVDTIRIQELPFSPEERSLTLKEYHRLLDAAKPDRRLHLLLQVMFCTGIRVSEVRFFTVEAFKKRLDHARIRVNCKKKNRGVLVAEELRREIDRYIRDNKIKSGPIFRTGSGKPLDRSAIWRQMKNLCGKAGVNPGKVFPHNLRKLFARLFYEQTHDIVQLACLLGHSSINTTKIYVKTTENEVRGRVEKLARVALFGKSDITTLSA